MHKNNFDLLRFLLAATVIFAHIIDLTHNTTIEYLRPYFDSHIAVTGFFLISGFLITRSFTNTKTTKAYFIKRANRLLPGYILIITISAIFLSAVSTLGLKPYFTSPDLFKYLLCNYSFLNFLHPCLPGVFQSNINCAVNGALWTLKVEVGFYIIIPFIIPLIQRSARKGIYLIAIYIAALLFRLTMMRYYQFTGNRLFDILGHQLPAFMDYFACGIAMHYYLDKFLQYKHILLAIALPLFIFEYHYDLELLRPITQTILIFYFAYSFKVFNNFGKHGDFSYGIYIYHFPLIQLCITLGFFQYYNPYLVGAGIVLTVFILAVISWNLLEKRFIGKAKIKQAFPTEK